MRCWLIAVLLVPAALAQTGKRPLNHNDYDGWRSIAGQHLSPDGKWLAYGLFPQAGDGQVVVRDLVTGQETRHPAGSRPTPTPAATPEETAVETRGVTIQFAADSKTLAFSTFPTKAENDKARKERKTGDQAPKDGLTIVDLASGRATHIDRVKRFAMPEKAAGYLAYLREPQETRQAPAEAKPQEKDDEDQQRGGRGGRGGAAAGANRPEFGTDLVLRSLADSTERAFTDVVEFSLTDDGKLLVYAVSARDNTKNGVFTARPGSTDPPATLLDGKGKFARLTWDENQTQLAFLSDRDGQDSKPAKWKLYRWDRKSTSASLLAGPETPGFRKEFVISDRGAISFSKDGSRIFFGCGPPRPETPAADSTNADTEEKAQVDLWHYKDDYINPVQKVRAERDRNRSFTAAYLIPERKVVQLADNELAEVTLLESSEWAIGTDDREYRRMADFGERYSDSYLINGITGERKLLSRKGGSRGAPMPSPGGRFLLFYDGKDWNTVSIPDGKATNLTAKLPVKFFNESTDVPDTPPAYGAAGWTSDGKWVLLYDKYDIWRVSPDGSSSTNLTAGYGRAHDLRLRYVRTEADPRERWIDPARPLLLQAENQKTWETGVFRATMEPGAPNQLLMAARYFTPPVKAKDADVYLLTAQSFTESPNLFTTDASFKELRKVSDANPQQAGVLWGTSEIVQYKNADGVPLTAALYKPENFDPQKHYPMLVYIYEKLTDRVNRYVDPRPSHSINITYYVSNGYLVLTPDIVYTTGYPGQSAMKCVLPAIQAVVDKGFVDEKAIGIQGHSWGGYQIAYMVTQTKRFRAVAAGAPVADMISAYDGVRWGTGIPRQFQYEHSQSRIGGSIWQYPTRFIENSPIFWADRVETPVMILHNDADDAVPWYQGIEFYLALRRLGKEVYMFVYNGEPHGLRRRPDQKDYTIRLQQYFDHFLKGAPAPDWMEKGVPFLEKDKTALSASQ